VAEAASKITSSLGNALAQLALDKEYAVQRACIKSFSFLFF